VPRHSAPGTVIVRHDTFEPVSRPRVNDLLARAARRRIGLVLAPAGYGKSVAVTHYLADAEVPNVWFVVRDEHKKLLGFAGGLANALAPEVPGLERGLLGAYQNISTEAERPRALAAWFAAQLDDCRRTIVVDDVHVILEEPDVREFIAALIERAPSRVRWFLLGRSALDLPLATWIADGHAGEAVSEDDLRIRSDEAAAIARACDVALGAEHVEQLLRLTAGWPAAFIFALRAAAHGTDLGRIAVETREKLYAYLADQAFGALSSSEQQFLLATALLPVVDLKLLAAAGWDAPGATYTRLRRHASFIVPDSATTFHYHGLFADFLQHRLRLLGPAAYERAQLASAALLEKAGRADLALRLRRAAKDRAGVVRMLRDQASSLTLDGMVDAIEDALLWLPPATLRSDPVLLGLLARARNLRSAFAESETLYRAAIEISKTSDERAKLRMSFATSLHNRGRFDDAFAVLRDLDPNDVEDLTGRVRLLAHLGVLRAIRREFDEAQRLADETLARTVAGDPELRAQVLYNACLVSHYSNRFDEARARVTEALVAAEESANSYIIARCCHFLSVVAMNDGDWDGAARLHKRVLVHARREGDLGLVNFSVQIALNLAPMRGDAAGIAEADAALGGGSETYPDAENARSFARAMLAAWSGDFQTARREAESGIQSTEGMSQRDPILSLPHAALYHAAAGDRGAALAALDRATAFLAEFSATGTHATDATLLNISHVVLAVTHALLLRSRAANEILSQLERSDRNSIPAVATLARAARTFNRVAGGVTGREALDRDLGKVRDVGLGGYADLFAVLPVGIARSAAAFGTLTKAEMQMLRLIARGGTTKAIAVELARSPDTVETHVRAILRKLGCKSRSEALALARDHGIL
jgi:LuxR family maltose regulon positive regulatory protein